MLLIGNELMGLGLDKRFCWGFWLFFLWCPLLAASLLHGRAAARMAFGNGSWSKTAGAYRGLIVEIE
jgi:hypothetical protein